MYGIVSILGSILRQIYLPNPFVNILPNPGIADFFNLVAVGTIISFLYNFNYALVTFSFYAISLLIKNVIIATVIYLILYIIVCTFLYNLRSKTINF